MSKRKLLLADDSITIQKVVNLTFADEGVEVITVGDGDAAVEKIAEVSPDLVLADVHMPGLNGYQICEWIRGNPTTRGLPVILLVGSFEPFDETEAARVGANAYLTKPFQSIRQLVSQVTDLMEPSRTEEGNGHRQVEAESSLEVREPAGEAEVSSAARIGETNDIDSLYDQSFGEPVVDEREMPAAHFVDAGMDDEMIETSFADGGRDSHSGIAGNVEQPSYGESSYRNEEEAPSAERAYYEEAAAFDGIKGDEEATGGHAPSADETSDYTGGPQVGEFHYEEPPSPDALDRHDVESSKGSERVDYEASDPDRADSASDDAPYVDHFAATEQIPPMTAHEQPESFSLDEADLLELPPLDTEKTIEIKTTRELVEEEANKQVVTLSPELMESIVAKVVEKLSKNN